MDVGSLPIFLQKMRQRKSSNQCYIPPGDKVTFQYRKFPQKAQGVILQTVITFDSSICLHPFEQVMVSSQTGGGIPHLRKVLANLTVPL